MTNRSSNWIAYFNLERIIYYDQRKTYNSTLQCNFLPWRILLWRRTIAKRHRHYWRRITKGYNLPANYIIHTVGPIIFDRVSYHDKIDLANCYKSCLELAVQNGFKNIVFCCIATGTFKFPRDLGSKIAVTTVSNWLKENNYPIKVVFCVYNDHDRKLYEEKFKELNLI